MKLKLTFKGFLALQNELLEQKLSTDSRMLIRSG